MKIVTMVLSAILINDVLSEYNKSRFENYDNVIFCSEFNIQSKLQEVL